MMIDRLRVRLGSSSKYDPPNRWYRAVYWVPAGYACTRVVGEGTPVLVVGLLAVTLAGLHRAIPGVVEVAAGGASLMVTVNEVLDGDCRRVLGPGGTAVVLGFVTAFAVSAFVRLLGSASLHEAGRHLLIATVAVELALSLLGPVVEGQGRVLAALALLVVLLAAAALGLRAGLGIPLLGGALVAVEATLAFTDHVCGMSGAAPLVGTTVFAAVGWYLASRPSEPYVTQLTP
ncbi:MAG TPA: hypothetical protein VGO78_06860 [Acidimicrobiales bacterium]|jgi:hypothetical protein|nr:hypothetical protein [Acidimicrobiales bacterium]